MQRAHRKSSENFERLEVSGGGDDGNVQYSTYGDGRL